jgi:selenium metabolism protein YedF
MKTVDAKGKLCPLPLILTKKALGEIAEIETLEILLDNETSVKNVTRFLEDHKMAFKLTQKGKEFNLLVSKTGVIPESTNVEEYCEVELPQKSNYMIAFQRDVLGDGVKELGILLIKAFVNTLPEVDIKPTSLVFLNSGIVLTLIDSPVIDSLKKLEKIGVEILVCGTCLDYYQKKTELGVGKISNMYDILDRLSRSGNVVYP